MRKLLRTLEPKENNLGKDKTDMVNKASNTGQLHKTDKRTAESEEKKHRRRVALACLNCKRRKVRCDKQKPCTGCVKNNVGHLCLYLDPVWAVPLAQQVAEEREEGLPREMEEVVRRQQQEIEDLRAALAQATGASVDAVGVSPASGISSAAGVTPAVGVCPVVGAYPADDVLPVSKNYPMSVLTKLSPGAAPLVADDEFYSFSGFLRARTVGVVSLYSWLNSIKLDPQLTALWFKITSLQKSYHLYKKDLLGSSKGDRTCGHTQCPVVACEFNFMVEEMSQQGTPMSLSVSAKSEPGDSKHYLKRFNDASVDMLASLQKMWLDMCDYGRGEKLTYAQLVFLVDFYLGTELNRRERACDVELRHLVRFFAAEIMAVVRRDHDGMQLDIAVFLLDMSDAEVSSRLRLKGIHLSLLALVVDEALGVLRHRSPSNDAIMCEFHRLFPLELLHQGVDVSSQVLLSVHSFVALYTRDTRAHTNLHLDLLALFSLHLVLLNRLLSLYKRDVPLDVRASFSVHLQSLLEMIHNDGSPVQLWMDPAHIRLLGALSSHARTTELRLLFCQIWADLLRIVCVAITLLPIVKHNDRLNQLMEEFLLYIGDAEPLNRHSHYLESLDLEGPLWLDHKEHCANLTTSIRSFYLIARAALLLRSGVLSVNLQVTVNDLVNIVAQFSAWSSHTHLGMLPMTRYFEVKIILNFLLFLFSMLVFFQCEDQGDAHTVSKLIPTLFSQCMELNKFLQVSMVQFSKAVSSGYVMAAVAENLSLFSHLLAGLLIRFVADTNESSSGQQYTGLLVYSSKLDNSNRIVIPLSTKKEVIGATDQSIDLLEKFVGTVHHRRTNKIWKFYMTFIRNSHKMNPAAYAKIHEKAFGSSRLIDSCPVFSGASNSYPLSSVRLELQLCPVLHPASPIPMIPKTSSRKVPPALSGCPVAHLSKRSRIDSVELKRLCPFDHEALKSKNGPQFQESNLRKSPEARPEEELMNGHKRRVTPTPLLRSSSLSSWNIMPPSQNTPPSPPGTSMIDWDTLPHFNFDVGDENMVMQINNDLHGSWSTDSMF